MSRLAPLITTLVAVAIALIGVETILRLTSHHPYAAPAFAAPPPSPPSSPVASDSAAAPPPPPPGSLIVETGGRLYEPDSELGYRPVPGRFIVTLPPVRPFLVTHDANSTRATHGEDGSPRAQQAWFFGCSFTYGWGLNDQETFAWKIRAASNELDVVNFGVSGYGNVHSLLQFRKALQEGHKPKFAALVYASFHDERNSLLRFYRKNHVGQGVIFPHAKLQDGKLVTVVAPVEYQPWPLQRNLAVVEFAENAYNRNEDWLGGSQLVTKAVLREFVSLASAHSVPAVVFGIWNNDRTREIVAYAKTIGAIAADVSEDLNQPGGKVEGDTHPSAAVNERYAKKMIGVLRENRLY